MMVWARQAACRSCGTDGRPHACVHAQAYELFEDKYTVLMVEDVGVDREEGPSAAAALDAGGGKARPGGAAAEAQRLNTPRVAFHVVLSSQAQPPSVSGWKTAAAVVLGLLLVGSCGQLAMAANITKLPKEAIEWWVPLGARQTAAVP